jgi:hypothetical protein
MHWSRRVGLIVLFTLALASCAKGETRSALVIGNADYDDENLKIKGPIEDAKGITKVLKGLRYPFKVDARLNLNRKQMEEAIRDFAEQLGKNSMGQKKDWLFLLFRPRNAGKKRHLFDSKKCYIK